MNKIKLCVLCLIAILIIYTLTYIYKKIKYNNYYNNNIVNEYLTNYDKDNLQYNNMLFTSAGDNTDFDNLWCENNRNYDIYVSYYGDSLEIYNKYKNKVDYIQHKKGYKWPNFYHFYKNHPDIIKKYDKFFIVDDDIIISTNDINKLFEISTIYNLDISGPTFSKPGEIHQPIAEKDNKFFLRYTNFVENNTPLMSKLALNNFFKLYKGILNGYGVDFLYIYANKNLIKQKKIALIDDIPCINPYPKNKKYNRREWNNNLMRDYLDKQKWRKIKKQYNIKDEKKYIVIDYIYKL